MEAKRTVKVVISIDVETTKSVEEIKRALERGIYRGLDTEPNYVAPPKDVKINYCQERLHIHDVSNSDEYTRGYKDGWRDCCKDVKEFG